MPVASYHQGPHKVGPKQIHAPKEASERGWWGACRKVFGQDELPAWSMVRDDIRIDVTDEVIHFAWSGKDIFIARRRNMR